MSDDPYDLSAPDPVALAAAEAERTEKLDLEWLMQGKRGRRIVHRLLSQAGVNRLSFTGEAASTFFNEGRRSVGNQLMAGVISAAPERYLEMLKEHS